MSLVYVCIIIACSSLRMRENCFTLATDFQNGCLYGCHTLCFTNMGLWPVFAYTLPFTIVNCSQGFHYPHYSTSSTTLHTTVMLSHGHKSVRACANCRKRRKICEWYEMT
ncbi:uncharacterized protein LOC126916888 isoform X4 [Bombus affinis]|uniref:uncharacterized protein LOC126916888 isoform X4 n=1 Tax=Bombus affinis TaxID=309941 RepID=UPI0021B70CDD|nr:uncharacterized protein LOC126916888 isoform X4 [Bombus affinis]